MCDRPYQPEKYLDMLGMELLARGLKCEIITTGSEPRLWLNAAGDSPIYCKGDDFEDHVMVSLEPDGIWRFWWPWIQPIAPVTEMSEAVDHFIDVYREDH